MNKIEYLESQDLIKRENNEYILTKRAQYLGFNTIEEIEEVVEDIFIIDFLTKTIIIPYRYTQNPVAVVGESISEYLIFRAYNDLTITPYIDLTNENIFAEVIWKNEADKLEGIFRGTKTIDETDQNIITFVWPIPLKSLKNSGILNCSIRFVNYVDNQINLNLSVQPIQLKIANSLNLISTNLEGDYTVITTIGNPYLSDDMTYIIDCGDIGSEV